MSNAALKPVWKDNFRISSYDIDFNSRLRISNLCGFFQEIAGKHAEHLGLGFFKLQEAGMVWMLSRLYIKIHDYPVWEDVITIETWPSGMEGLLFRRDFNVCRGKNKMVSAASFWLALNIETLRPQVFPIDKSVIKNNTGRFAIEGSMKKIPSPTNGKSRSREVRFSDLDQNKHVNNTRYIEWILDQLDLTRLEKGMPRYFAIEYKHEVKANHIVQLRDAHDPEEENTLLLEGTITETNQVCFRSKVTF